jgi:hypothetical protein
LALNETDIDQQRGSLLIRHGKGRQATRSRDGSVRVRAARRLADPPRVAPAGAAGLRHRRTHPRAPVGRDRRAS